jgi:hypothetical protein
MINPTMLRGLGSLIESILGSFAVDQDRARIQGPGRGAERITEDEEMRAMPKILLDSEGFPVRRDPDRMGSEFEFPFILTPGGGLPEDMRETPVSELDIEGIRNFLSMLFNRG